MFTSRIDRAFWRYCRTGDPAPLGLVFDQTAKELLRVAVYLCGNRADAEDVLQRTFVAAIEGREKFDRRQRVLPWLCGIAVNLSRGVVRDRARRERAVGGGAVARDAAAEAADRELEENVVRLREELGTPYREVLELHLEQGLNAKEIGARLGRPAGTVRTQLVRALELLRRRLPSGFMAGLVPFAPQAAVIAKVKGAVMAVANAAAPVATAAGVGVVSAVTGGVLVGKKILFVVPLLAVALGVGVYVAMPEQHAAPERQANRALALAQAARQQGADPAPLQRMLARNAALRVVDDRTLQPIAEARLLAVDAHSTWFDPDQATVLASADAAGMIDGDLLPHPGGMLVFAPGYLPAVPPELHGDSLMLCLHRGASLTVRAVGEDDMPVAGVDLMLTRPGTGTVEPMTAGRRLGNPAHEEAVWTACTDERGVATFPGLPDQEVRLHAWHATMCPLTDLGIGSEGLRPPATVELRMGLLYGLCARPPDQPELPHVLWQVDWMSLDHTVAVQARLQAAWQALRQRFPGCCVYVARPSSAARSLGTSRYRCRGIGVDGSVWEAEAELVPLAEVDPTPLVLQPGKQCGLVQIDVVDEDGTPRAMPLQLVDQGTRKAVQSVTSGSADWLPYGSYRIAFRFGTWFARVPESELLLRVGDGEPANGRFVVRVPMKLAKLQIAVKLPRGDDRPAVVHIGVGGNRDYNVFGMMNLDARAGPWTLWAPYAEFEVDVQSGLYERASQRVVVDRPEVHVEVALQPRRPADPGAGPQTGPAIPDKSR